MFAVKGHSTTHCNEDKACLYHSKFSKVVSTVHILEGDRAPGEGSDGWISAEF